MSTELNSVNKVLLSSDYAWDDDALVDMSLSTFTRLWTKVCVNWIKRPCE